MGRLDVMIERERPNEPEKEAIKSPRKRSHEDDDDHGVTEHATVDSNLRPLVLDTNHTTASLTHTHDHGVTDHTTVDSNLRPLTPGNIHTIYSPTHTHDHGVTEIYKEYDLYLAAKNGDLDYFKRILDDRVSSAASIDVLSRLSFSGNTFVHVAAKHGNEDILAFIASMKPSLVLEKNLINGDTALHLAAKGGDEPTVKVLVQIHRDLLVTQSLPQNNLLIAKNERGNTALHEALLNGWDSIAIYLIEQDSELLYCRNKDGESALYLAAKAGFVDCVSSILRLCTDQKRFHELFKTKSPIFAAIQGKRTDVLDAVFAIPRLIQMIDRDGKNPLHFAASLGHLEEVRYLLKKYAMNATRKDKEGILPIHLASFEGHVDIISLLLQVFPDPEELLDGDGCNILHIAAKSGKYNVFNFFLKNPHLDRLINMKDKFGNTPLHWASMLYQPKIVSILTWNKRVYTKALNNDGLTALDVAEKYMPRNPQFRQRLTWAALKAASVPRSRSSLKNKASGTIESLNMDNYKDRVNTLLLVATLVATVTFAAGFTMPGGYNSSESGTADLGMATMLRDEGFHVFLICDAIAMYSSILVATALMWAQLGDLNLVLSALTLAVPLLGIALIMMSVAFTAGIIIVVIKLRWLRLVVLAMSISFAVILFLLLLPFCTPLTSRNRILRYLSYYPFCLLILVTVSS